MADQPNVILICADQWRGDCLSIENHPDVHTPYLDQLALGGCRFSHAYSAVPTCIAARAGLYTGLTQRTHGRVGYRDGVPWNYDTTLAGEFTRHGYQTQAVGKMHVYPERSQMGFQNVILHDGYLHFARKQENYGRVDDYTQWLSRELGRQADHFEHGLNCNSFVVRPWDKDEYLHPTIYVVTQGIDFLRRRDPRKPFFLYLSFHRPHPPLDPPQWAFDQYNDKELAAPPVGKWADLWAKKYGPLGSHPRKADLSCGKMDPGHLRRARAGYYGHMSHIDHQINRFLETLTDYGWDKNTYVCFTSDHGELLGDHNLFRKSLPYEGSARVPLIISGPRDSGIKRNMVQDQVVELRDIMPTLLDCAGLPIPGQVEGLSLLPALRGDTTPVREYVHGEHVAAGQSVHYCTDGHRKYVWLSDRGEEQFFDLDNDPQELNDLSGDKNYGPDVLTWRSRLVRELEGREEGYSDGTRLIAGRKPGACLSHIL